MLDRPQRNQNFSGGTGVGISNGVVSIGQSVATDAVVTFTTVNANVTGQVSDISNHDTGDLTEGTNQYFTQARARGSVSVTQPSGDGSLAYDSSTGGFTYTGPSASETRAHFSGGTGVGISNGVVSIGQEVATTSNVTFNNITVDGNLTINGDTTTIDTTSLVVEDPLIKLSKENTSDSVDIGFYGLYGTSETYSGLLETKCR